MNRLIFTILFFLMVVLLACTDKDIDIELAQDACKRFKISSPSYQLFKNPCQDSSLLVTQVRFEYNRSADCLHQVQNQAVFYQANNAEIAQVLFPQILERNALTINDKSVVYQFEANFINRLQAKDFSHVILDFNTQNELGVKSNTLQIRINSPCVLLDSSTYELNRKQINISPAQTLFSIRLWDNAAEDGDIVSVYLNGEWIIENHSLLKAGTDFNFSTSLLHNGPNDLVVFALNEGSSGPNTASIAINGEEIENFSPGLLSGEAVRINF